MQIETSIATRMMVGFAKLTGISPPTVVALASPAVSPVVSMVTTSAHTGLAASANPAAGWQRPTPPNRDELSEGSRLLLFRKAVNRWTHTSKLSSLRLFDHDRWQFNRTKIKWWVNWWVVPPSGRNHFVFQRNLADTPSAVVVMCSLAPSPITASTMASESLSLPKAWTNDRSILILSNEKPRKLLRLE